MTEPTPETAAGEPQVVSTRLALLVMALLLAVAVAWLMWLREASRAPLVGAWSEDQAARHAPHWYDSSEGDLPHHHDNHGPELAGDGRVGGALPFAWRPRTYDARVKTGLGMSWPTPLPLSGARVVLSDAPPAPVTVTLEVGGERREVTLSARDTLVTLDAPTASMFVQLTLPKTWPEPLAVAELEPLFPGARAWLMAPGGGGDLEAELLRAYGARAVQRGSYALQAAEVLGRASTLILTNHPLPEAWRKPVHAWVRAGGLLIELGPRAGGCPSLTAAPSEAARAFYLEGAPLPEVSRWTGPLAAPGDAGAAPGEALIRTRGESPRAVLARYRRGEGACLRWWGDVATEWRRQRQGLEERANEDVDGKGGFQPRDLLAGTLARGDHDTPSADLLGFAVAASVASPVGLMVAPLPPGAETVVVLTADQDFVPDAVVLGQSQALPPEAGLSAMLTAGAIGAAPDVRYDASPENLVARDTALALGELGHGVGIHPNLWRLEAGRAGYEAAVEAHAEAFEEAFRTRALLVRNHHLVWSGYVEMARHQARAGLAMNFDYIALAFAPEGELGYMAGGAIPARFGDPEGRVVPILQQATQLDDHVLLPTRFGYHPYDAASLEARSRALLKQAARFRTPLVVNHHPFWWSEDGGRWQRSLVEMASEVGAPIWGGGRWLRFVRGQRDVRVWCSGEGSCTVWSTAPNTSLLVSADRGEVRLDGQPVSTDDGARRQLGGQAWRLLKLTAPGSHRIDVGDPTGSEQP